MDKVNGAKPVQVPDVLSAASAATYLQISYMTVLRLLNAERLPGRKVGGQWRIRRDDLDAMLLTGTWQTSEVAKDTPLYDLQQTL